VDGTGAQTPFLLFAVHHRRILSHRHVWNVIISIYSSETVFDENLCLSKGNPELPHVCHESGHGLVRNGTPVIRKVSTPDPEASTFLPFLTEFVDAEMAL
jgi:hypothetical protein